MGVCKVLLPLMFPNGFADPGLEVALAGSSYTPASFA